VPTLARRAPMGLSVLAVALCFLFWPESLTAQYWVASGAAIFALCISVIFRRFCSPSNSHRGAELLAGLLGAFGAAAFGSLDVWLYARLKSGVDRSADEAPAVAALVLGDVLRCYPGCAHFPLKGPTLQHGYDTFQICVALFERQITRRVRHDIDLGVG
jgi:hypothetical protein